MLTQLWRGKARRTSRQSLRSYLYRPAPDVMAAVADGRVVLLDGRRERYFGLDEVGAAGWEAVGAGRRSTAIAGRLEAGYDAARERRARDGSTFLWHLAESRRVLPV